MKKNNHFFAAERIGLFNANNRVPVTEKKLIPTSSLVIGLIWVFYVNVVEENYAFSFIVDLSVEKT